MLRCVIVCALWVSLVVGLDAPQFAAATPPPQPGVAPTDPYLTAVDMAALVGGGSLSGLDRIIVVTGESFADAVVASGLAGFLDHGGQSGRTAILLTKPTELPPAVADAISASEVPATDILMVGGTAAASEDVRAAVAHAAGWNGTGTNPVTRIGGEDRYHTAAAVIDYVNQTAGTDLAASYRTVLVASGEQFPDALVAGVLAYRNGHLMALALQSAAPEATLDAVDRLQANCAVMVGGAAALAPKVEAQMKAVLVDTETGCGVERIAGRDRFDTAAHVAARFVAVNGPPREALVASGETFTDALAIGPLAGENRPLLLTTAHQLSAPALRWLLQHRATLNDVRVIGGANSINPAVASQISDATQPAPAPVVGPAPSAPAPTAPAAPTITSVTAGNATLSVAFTAGDDGGSAITNYEYSTDDGGTWVTPDPPVLTSPLPITALTNYTGYHIQLRALNSVGSGAASATVNGTPTTFAIGDTGPGGGIVFYVSTTAFTVTGSACADACRYLEAAPSDAGLVHWRSTNTSTPNTSQLIGSGHQNTYVAMAGTDHPAAEAARNASHGGKNDWFLPSKEELNELCKYARRQITGDTAVLCTDAETLRDGFYSGDDLYWSSSEHDASGAWRHRFKDALQSASTSKVFLNPVRPVRAFGQPLAPTITAVTAGNATLSVTFTAGDDGGSPITNYEYSTNNGATWTPRDPMDAGSPLAITGLTNDIPYNVQIRAVNAVGSGAASNMISGTPAFTVGAAGPGGGIVFYVHPGGGTFDCGPTLNLTCRYLEAAPAPDGGDLERTWATATSAPNNQTTSVPGALSSVLGAGLTNTEAILQQVGNVAASSAAVYAWEYSTTVDGVVISDWFLPSKDELNELCKYARNTGEAAGAGVQCAGGIAGGSHPAARGFEHANYWSSSELTGWPNIAWYQQFGSGFQSDHLKDTLNRVRPIRAF